MKSLSKIFGTIRTGIAYIEKASKVLQSIDLIGKHLKNLVDDLENLWGVQKSNEPEINEA